MSPTLDLDLVSELRTALDGEELVLYYQPEVDLTSGAIVGMEALLRWRHPTRGLLRPDAFLPAAEASGLLPHIGRWVLRECVAERHRWRPFDDMPSVGLRQLWINVSAVQLTQPDFVDTVVDLVSDLPPGALGLEFSEETLGRIGSDAAGWLRRLREAGCLLAVDDFGTWYSALAGEHELPTDAPIDAVKLDRRFVRGLGIDLDDDTVVGSVIRLAHAQGLYVVAEGVESWTEGARLCELGCDRAYGYLFCGPQPAARARQMLERGAGWQRMPTPGLSGASLLTPKR